MSDTAKAPPKMSCPSPAAGSSATGSGASRRASAAAQKAAIRITLAVVKPRWKSDEAP